MAKREYPPLHFAKNFSIGSLKEILSEITRFYPPSPWTADEVRANINALDADGVCEMVEDRQFLEPGYAGPYPVLEKYLIKLEKSGISRIFFDQDEDNKNGWQNIFQMTAVSEKWRQNKQVYEFDPDFSAELCKTEKLRIYPALFRRLPYSTFYIDLTKDPKFSQFDGVFVSVHVKDDAEMAIYVDRIISEIFFGGMDLYRKGDARYENGMAYFEYDKAAVFHSCSLDVPDDIRKLINHPSIQDGRQVSNEFYPDLMSFILQALTYMVSREPEILESATTQKTYRPAAVVKDRFSEIRKWDVGVRYGNRIRLIREKQQKETGESNDPGTHPGRKPPRPHSRCAHWQRYHTGKGRTELEIKWIEPTFVGARENAAVERHVVTP